MSIFILLFAVATMICNEWQREPHGWRAQRRAIVFILKELELIESFHTDSPPCMETIYWSCWLLILTDLCEDPPRNIALAGLLTLSVLFPTECTLPAIPSHLMTLACCPRSIRMARPRP